MIYVNIIYFYLLLTFICLYRLIIINKNDLKEKWKALIEEVKIRHSKKQPILIGTVSVEVSEQISKDLKKN
ncbi:MAG: hypothetical protein Q8731_00635, partial [Candidatus Phytoplasma australasiaticum]|nr:hypothetical protein [Candidatus Phytoplasma australasiaticum]